MAKEITIAEFRRAREVSRLYSSNVKDVNPEDLSEMAKHAIHRCVHFGLKDYERALFTEEDNGNIFCEACNCEIARPTEYESNKEVIMKAISVIDSLIVFCATNGYAYDKIDNIANTKAMLYEMVIPGLDAMRDYYEEDDKK